MLTALRSSVTLPRKVLGTSGDAFAAACLPDSRSTKSTSTCASLPRSATDAHVRPAEKQHGICARNFPNQPSKGAQNIGVSVKSHPARESQRSLRTVQRAWVQNKGVSFTRPLRPIPRAWVQNRTAIPRARVQDRKGIKACIPQGRFVLRPNPRAWVHRREVTNQTTSASKITRAQL
jgi:hypothetical protein